MKMEQAESSETLAFKLQMPWKNTEESIQQGERGWKMKIWEAMAG
jgi:hypothetical protein